MSRVKEAGASPAVDSSCVAAVSAAGYGRRAAFSRTAVVSVGDEASGGIEAAGGSSPKIIVRREGSE